MPQFLEAVLIFGVVGLLCIGGLGAGTLVLTVRLFNKSASNKLGEIFQPLMGIFGLLGCIALYFVFYAAS